MSYQYVEDNLASARRCLVNNETIQLRTRMHACLTRKAVHLQRLRPGRLLRFPQAAIEVFDLAVDVAALAYDYARNCHYVFKNDFGQILAQSLNQPNALWPGARSYADIVASPASSNCRNRLLHALIVVIVTRQIEYGYLFLNKISGERGYNFFQCCLIICDTLVQHIDRIRYAPEGQVNMTPAALVDSFEVLTQEFRRLSDAAVQRPIFDRMFNFHDCQFQLHPVHQASGISSDVTWFDSIFYQAVHAAQSAAHSLVGKSYQQQAALLRSVALKSFATMEQNIELLQGVESKILRPIFVIIFLQICWFKARRLQAAIDEPEAIVAPEPPVFFLLEEWETMSESQFFTHYAEEHVEAVHSCLAMVLQHTLQYSTFHPNDQPIKLAAVSVAAFLLEFSISGIPDSFMDMHHVSMFEAKLAFGDRLPNMKGVWNDTVNNISIRQIDNELANLVPDVGPPSSAPVNLIDTFSFVNNEQSEAQFVCTICTDLIYFGHGAQFHLIDNCSSASASSVEDKLACGRLFCKPCIQEWIGSQGSTAACPVCNFQISGSFLHQGQVRQALLCDAPSYVYAQLKRLPMTCNSCEVVCEAVNVDKHSCAAVEPEQEIIMLD